VSPEVIGAIEIVRNMASGACLLGGSLFCIIGGIGIVRMPDFYSRGHAAGITDTLGAGLILIGLMFLGGFSLISVKLLLILVFLFITGPTATHALVKAAYAGGLAADCEVRASQPRAEGGD
jgi:multicomponent Na+:H+ antiporter subunit G